MNFEDMLAIPSQQPLRKEVQLLIRILQRLLLHLNFTALPRIALKPSLPARSACELHNPQRPTIPVPPSQIVPQIRLLESQAFDGPLERTRPWEDPAADRGGGERGRGRILVIANGGRGEEPAAVEVDSAGGQGARSILYDFDRMQLREVEQLRPVTTNKATFVGHMPMDLDDVATLIPASGVPDDVWIDIFESTDSPAAVAMLRRTCRRFNTLGLRPSLRELRWTKMESTIKNLQDWDPSDGIYKDLVVFPRKVTIGVPFEFNSRTNKLSQDEREAEYELHDWIYRQLPRFTSLNEVAFENTVICSYVYAVLAQIPALRTLSISNCSATSLIVPLADRHLQPPRDLQHLLTHHPDRPHPYAGLLENLPITHLSFDLGTADLSDRNLGPPHPLHFLGGPNLTSLAIRWTEHVSSVYTRRKWTLPQLTALEVTMPVLTRDLVDTLVVFLDKCLLRPRMKLSIKGHNLNQQDTTGAATTPVTIPMRGLWSYTGPLGLVVRQEEGTMTQMVMNEPLELPGVLRGMRRLPRRIKELELQVRKWDVEILFAVRELFPGIRKLIIRYGSGMFPEDFLVTLGSSISEINTGEIALGKEVVLDPFES
ncbi:unnamed protein product [Cyclocybe aegerita]|uniref:F-box domain-containing protein n=1 Tax=Cyclocybe aegerita TaxID=1973307 RepID=A0A8S0WK87_CYCAE|nr:unnamed protein product [Cyclocybe aegerita]